MASIATNVQPSKQRRDRQKRHRRDQRQHDDASRAEPIRQRAAEEAAGADRDR